MDTKTLLCCGGGNGAHVLAGLAAHAGYNTKVLTLFRDEYSKWNNEITIKHDLGDDICGTIELITNQPEKAMVNVDIVCLVVPAFAHETYLQALKPYLSTDKHVILGAMPGSCGFDIVCHSILGSNLSQSITLFQMETLPWACRIQQYGERVEVLGTKKVVDVSVAVARNSLETTSSVVSMLQHAIGLQPKLHHVPSLLGLGGMMSINSILHPTLTYGQYRNWDGTTPFDTPPLFYEGVDEETGILLTKISNEVVTLRKQIESEYPGLDLSVVRPVHQWYIDTYGEDIADTSSMKTILNTNKGYKGLCHSMIEQENGTFLPNFNHRYLSEDLPFGLLVTRGIAELFGMKTPNIDRVIVWGQSKLGKEYIVDGKLIGKDVAESRCPQRFGFHDKTMFMEENDYVRKS